MTGILFFTKGDKTIGSSRQRVWFVAEKLKTEYGYVYSVMHGIAYPFWRISRARWRMVRDTYRNLASPAYTVLFVHKALFPWDITFLILAAHFFLRKKLIFDLDDAEWEHSRVKSILFARAADMVFCGSHGIQDWAKTYNRHTLFIPTVIDSAVYASYAVQHEDQEQTTIGWVGVGRAHFLDGHFSIIKPVLDALHANGGIFRFVIIGSQNYRPLKDYFLNTPYPVVFVDSLNWDDPSVVPRSIQEHHIDIGIMPIYDTPFNRFKCAFKAIEFMGCGVPVVASRVGEASVVIEDKKNGFLVESKEEWEEALLSLMRSLDRRRTYGIDAKQRIKKCYSYALIVPLIEEALRSVISQENDKI